MEDVSKELIRGYIRDLVAEFLYYDRKEDNQLPRGAIEDAVDEGIITVDDMVSQFRESLEKHFG